MICQFDGKRRFGRFIFVLIKINYLAHSLQLIQCLCVSKLNLFISIRTSLGRHTERCNIFSKFELQN